MGRIGFNSEQTDFLQLADKLSRFDNLIPAAVFSHFSHADSVEKSAREFTLGQARSFKAAVNALQSRFPGLQAHIQNSAAILDYKELQFDFVRPGIIMYGLAPSDEMRSRPLLKPVMELKSCVTAVKTVPAGTPIGYGRAFVTKRETTVATVPIGYADGYLRQLSSKGIMLVRSRRARVIGNVCMDQLMLDVTGIDGVAAGDVVTVYGSDGDEFYGADNAAADAGTISYELVCLVNKRVPRVYIKNGKIVEVKDLIVGV